MGLSTEDWIIGSNMLVALTSILVSATTEHDAIKAMRDTVINVLRAITRMTPQQQVAEAEEEKE